MWAQRRGWEIAVCTRVQICPTVRSDRGVRAASTFMPSQGIGAPDRSGYSVSDAGDVNGDGVDDLIIGAASPARALCRRELRRVRQQGRLRAGARAVEPRRQQRLPHRGHPCRRRQRLVGERGRRRERRRGDPGGQGLQPKMAFRRRPSPASPAPAACRWTKYWSTGCSDRGRAPALIGLEPRERRGRAAVGSEAPRATHARTAGFPFPS